MVERNDKRLVLPSSNLDTMLAFLPDVRNEITAEQMAAMRFLESRGQRFTVHFGYGNAVQKAWDLIEQETNVKGIQ